MRALAFFGMMFLVAAVILVIAFIVTAVITALASPVDAQPPHEDRAVVALARACVHEEGWEPRGCAAIYQALRNRGHIGETRAASVLAAIEAAPRISSILDEDVTPEEDPRAWVNQLELSCDRPADFPAELDWDGDYRARCGRIMEAARRLLSGRFDRRLPCRGPVVMWGGDCADPRGACDEPPPGYAAVYCGPEINNVFYRPARRDGT